MNVFRTVTSMIAFSVSVLLHAFLGPGLTYETLAVEPVQATADELGTDRFTHALYKRETTFQQTLLATRRQYTSWVVAQPDVRKDVEFEPWLATAPLSAVEAENLVRPSDGIDPAATLAAGRAVWSERGDLIDGKVVSLVKGHAGSIVSLARVVRSERPVRLTIGLGGGDYLDLWLNGQKIRSTCTRLTSGRYGCSYRVDGTRVDQLLVDLELEAGENTIVAQFTLGEEPSFFFSASPTPVPRFWEQVRRDFPANQNPLLDLVPDKWFDTKGWFAARDNALEVEFIERVIADLGERSATIRTELERMIRTGTAQDEAGWLDLCVRASVLASLQGDLDRLYAAVDALGQKYPNRYPLAALQERLDDYQQRLLATQPLEPADRATLRLMTELPQMQRRMLVELNPLIRGAEILFAKRFTYDSKHYYDDFQHIRRWGGNLCVFSPGDGHVREVVPQLTGGVFDRYDLSFDASRIAFGYRRPQPEGFRIYEIGVDGTGLRQVTHPPDDEQQRMSVYGKTSTGDSFYGSMGYQFWTDDVHPCYLPGGGFCFASTRSEHGVLCTPAHYLACTNLFRMRADGGGLKPLSHGALSEFTPTVMEDGRLLYNRWEYVFKGIAAVQPLWIMRPDGSGSEELYGDNVTNPGVFWQARQVPGHPRKVVCTGCGHEPLGIGQLLLLDLNKSKRTTEPMTSLTPNVRTENLRGLYQKRNGVWREDIYGPFYADPYPLSDQFFLVSCNPDRRYNDMSAYGIYLLDVFGNRVPIYTDPEISCWQPMPLRARQTPPVLPPASAMARDETTIQPMPAAVPTVQMPAPAGMPPGATATIFVSDVYRGLEGVPKGTVKYLRVMEQVPKPWAAEWDHLRGEDRSADGFGGHLAVSCNSHIWIAVLHGIAPVEEDGSANFRVPAGRNLFFQALDENFMQVQRMRTFVNFEPGERRSCIGCHEHRRQAPAPRLAMALSRPPDELSAQPGEIAPRPLYYPTDIQPLWDSHCVRCHDGTDPKAAPDLRGEMTTLFSRSYENLLEGEFVHSVREWAGSTYAMQHAEAVPPYTHGSHRSRVVGILREGHHDVQLSQEEWIKLATWIDCGAPYYGSYFGRRHLRYKGQPDFRPAPTLPSACGIAPDRPDLVTAEPLPARLIAHWPLDDVASGTARDASGRDHDAKVINGIRCEGLDGSDAIRLDGRGYLQCSGLGQHPALSIALWVRPDSLGNQWNPLLFCDEGQAGAVHFSLLADGSPNVAVNTGEWNWTHRRASSVVACDKWQHVALVCDPRFGGSVRFFIDGRPAGEARLGLGLPLDLYRLRVGAWNRWEDVPANNLHGQLDDVRIYSGMLREEEIARLIAER